MATRAAARPGDVETDGTDSLRRRQPGDHPDQLPVTIGGNAVSVIGDSTTEGSNTGGTPGTPGTPGEPGEPGEPGTPGEPG
ncbi:hypothetical protein HR12_45230, partial [Microbacterium sp. SUBG005]